MDRLVNIDVDGLDRAIEFYTSAFDFQVARRFGTDAVELVGGSSPIYLLNKAAGTAATASAAPLREYQRHWTPVHLDIVVADLEASVGRALAAGATQEKPVHISKWGRLALMADPFGHGFRLQRSAHRAADLGAAVEARLRNRYHPLPAMRWAAARQLPADCGAIS
jgi:predicted enzyme related to lactoylglutathione lyase